MIPPERRGKAKIVGYAIGYGHERACGAWYGSYPWCHKSERDSILVWRDRARAKRWIKNRTLITGQAKSRIIPIVVVLAALASCADRTDYIDGGTVQVLPVVLPHSPYDAGKDGGK